MPSTFCCYFYRTDVTDQSDILKMLNLVFSAFHLHRHGLHISGEEPKLIVLRRISQKNGFSFGLTAVGIRQLHMMLLMVILLHSFRVRVQLLLMNYHWSECCISVEQGLMELRKLGIEHRLWEASRKEIDQDSSTLIARKAAG